MVSGYQWFQEIYAILVEYIYNYTIYSERIMQNAF